MGAVSTGVYDVEGSRMTLTLTPVTGYNDKINENVRQKKGWNSTMMIANGETITRVLEIY